MFAPLLKKLFGSKNEREVKRMLKTVQVVNSLEEQMVALTDEQLRAKTEEFKARIAKGETLDQLLPEAFAVCREAGKRVMGMRHFDVQLIGGMTLHEGKIAEMRTGEGKTLVATLGVYLNALSGKGVHVITVNDYLARRDANWMRPLYEYLGRRSVLSHRSSRLRRSVKPTPPTSPTVPTTSSASITCATTWLSAWKKNSSASSILP